MAKQVKQPFNVADYLLTRLLQLNVTDVFQIPGDYVKHFTQTLEYFSGIATIGCINELDAGYAADAYGRTRGLAAISLQYGVSTFSALNAIAGAYVERSPVVVISATPGSDARNIGSMYDVLYHHSTGNLNADQAVYENVTVAAITLSTNEGAEEKIDKLLIAALTHRRPVYIACYKEVWGQPCKRPSKKPLSAIPALSQPAALEDGVTQAWAQITAAKNPLILAGIEILRFGLSGLLQDIINESGILYTTTSLGKTVLDEKGNKFIGTYSDAASISQVNDIVQNADCILSLGAIITDDYLWLVENKYSAMITSNVDALRVGYFKYDGVALQNFMEALLLKFKKEKGYPLSINAPKQPPYPEPWASNSDQVWNKKPNFLTYNRFFQHMMHFLDKQKMLDKIVMTFGVSSAMYVATNAYGLYQNSYISSAAWQCIGFETGAASGAQLGSGKRAWTIAGDGGFMMVCQSLSTLSRNNLNAVIFVMKNGVYAIEQVYVDITSFLPGPSHTFDAFDILPEWDYMALAKAYGANGYRAETIDQLNDVLMELKTVKDRPSLVEIIIPQKDLPQQMYRLGIE